jgi:hypothetical protein
MAEQVATRLIPVFAAMALTACAPDMKPDAKICTPFTTTATTTTAPSDVASVAAPSAAGAEGAAFDDCLHRWGYRLAPSGDSADVAARAVVAACGEALSRWNTQTLNQAGPTGSQASLDLHTGKSTTILEQRYDYAESKALFYVVQGRAGRCAAP